MSRTRRPRISEGRNPVQASKRKNVSHGRRPSKYARIDCTSLGVKNDRTQTRIAFREQSRSAVFIVVQTTLHSRPSSLSYSMGRGWNLASDKKFPVSVRLKPMIPLHLRSAPLDWLERNAAAFPCSPRIKTKRGLSGRPRIPIIRP